MHETSVNGISIKISVSVSIKNISIKVSVSKYQLMVHKIAFPLHMLFCPVLPESGHFH